MFKIEDLTFIIDLMFNVEDHSFYHWHYQDETFEEQELGLPMILPSHEEIEGVLDDKLISKKNGGYQKFLVR